MSLLATVTLAHVNGILRDSVVNTFGIKTNTTSYTQTQLDGITAALVAFYNATPPGTDRIGSTFNNGIHNYLSTEMSRTSNASTVRIYDLEGHLDGSPFGSPIDVSPFTLGAAGTSTPLPSEAAVVLTLEADGRAGAAVESDTNVIAPATTSRPKSRRTGRVFIGPCNSLSTALAGQAARPHQVFRDTILAAALKLDADLNAVAGDYDLAVWSRADARITACEAVSIDDAWDTQRRRGVQPTERRRLPMAEI
jgi:hypothetical protein